MYLARFDLRGPGLDRAPRAAQHRTALAMASWLDERGCGSIVVSEHHVSDDGYLPSPLPFATALAAVTTRTPIVVAAAVLPLYDPVRLAEDIVTLDHVSQGRAMVVLGLGYRPVEYELYGVDWHRRGAVADAKLARLLELLDAAAAGTDPVRVTPAPHSAPRPLLCWGGRSLAAAQRAGRHGLGFFAQTDDPALRTTYEEAARAAGHQPGLCVLPPADMPLITFVHDDVDTGWAEVGPAMLVDAAGYHDWAAAAGTAEGTASMSPAASLDDLRRAEGAHRVVTPDQARHLAERYGTIGLHPLCGGLDPDLAWTYLRRAVAAVGPAPSPAEEAP